MAAELVKEFISPIVSKIDPVTLGEHQRALRIAHDYGLRLNEMCGSLKTEDDLISLVRDYPDHGFVIDRKEARERLFKNVEAPDKNMVLLYEWIRAKLILREQSLYGSPLVKDLKQEKDRDETTQSGQKADAAEVEEEVDQSE